MYPLLLAIVCSAAIALIFKVAARWKLSKYTVITANYLMAGSIGAAAGLFGTASLPRLNGENLRNSLPHLGRAVRNGEIITDGETGFLWAVVCGLAAGVIFFLAFINYERSVRKHGAGLAGAFAKLGIFLPMTLSLIVWRELPSVWQWFGLGLAAVALLLVHLPWGRSWREAVQPALLLLFLFSGVAEFSNKVFQKYGDLAWKPIFLVATFGSAFVYSLVVWLLRRERWRWRDVLVGLLLGLPNLFSSYFLITALETIPAAVAFPIFGAGTIVLINLVGVTVFRERLGRREWAAIILTVLAVVAVNL